MSDDNNVVVDNTEPREFRYDPTAAISKAGKIQDKMMDHVLTMDMAALINNPKIMEGVNGMLSNINSTGTAVMRNSLVESNSDLGNMADAVLDRMVARGMSLIKTVDTVGGVGRIPENLEFDDADFENIEEGMLVKGIVTTNYDDFAKDNGLESNT